MKNLNDKLLWALTPEARAALNQLEIQGWDRDLALSFLEASFPEESLYELPEGDDDVQSRLA